MNLTRASLSNPVAVLVAGLMIALFGLITLFRLPVQLTPEIEKPVIRISQNWRAAAPQEVESEIIEPQERVLRGLPGMTRMLSRARRGRSSITLTFDVGTDMRRAMIDVLNRINQVPNYPSDADEPVLKTVGDDTRPVAWFILKTTADNSSSIEDYKELIEDLVQARFEQVPGVALSEVRGGLDKEIRITFDPYRTANLGIELPKIVELAGGGRDISVGFADIGKRRYTVRFLGAYEPDELGEMILEWRQGRPIRLRDVATVAVTDSERESFVISTGHKAMAVNAYRENDVNVLRVMSGLKQAAEELRQGVLARAGISLEQVYDETLYIDRSIQMLTTNLVVGILLAIAVLWWFLRSLTATLIVAIAIPTSILLAFIVLNSTGHTLNVISLAGLAFAVGMVLDAGIVVLENIVRLREQGESPERAAGQGTAQVWGALMASTATTVAIFLPVVFLKNEIGQLFSELALTISITIVASLIIALSVTPTASVSWLGPVTLVDRHRDWWNRITDIIMRCTNTARQRRDWIIGLICLPVLLAIGLLPKADYLPEGNRNLVFAYILPPPGANLDSTRTEMGSVIKRALDPYVSGNKQPKIKNYFFVGSSRGAFMGIRAEDASKVDQVTMILNRTLAQIPDTIAFARQASLFGRLIGGNTIDVNIQGRTIEPLLDAAQVGYTSIAQQLPGARVRPRPGLALSEPELSMQANEQRIAEVGWNRKLVAGLMRALGDGLVVGEYFDGDRQRDILLRVEPWTHPEDLAAIPLATPNSGVIPVNELVTIERTAGPNEIRRVDRRRTITLQVRPPKDAPLEAVIQQLVEQVEPEIRNALPPDADVSYSGAADNLKEALNSIATSLILAIVILYLLMSALFRSFKDSLLVVVVIPLAAIGGVLTLVALDGIRGQNMDLLTMIGFIILLGLVVNNAILLVHQTRSAEREGMARREAVAQAVRIRLRPILMSTLTSLFGMLPLVLIPGAGTELYRGLATVIVGGLTVSTLFTLILLPSLLRIGEDKYSVA